MSIEIVYQLGISLFGVTAFLLVTSSDRKMQCWGVFFGMCANPFWWTMMVVEDQWIMFPVHALYTYGWLKKGWSLWKNRNIIKNG